MKRALTIIGSLHLVSIVCVFDQATYSTVCEIKWKKPLKFRNCLLMMGIFHVLTNNMGIPKKRFYDAGMKYVLVQSATIAEGSIERALNEKIYNRGVRQYKIFYEALVRLMIRDVFQGVEDCCMEGSAKKLHSMGEFTNETYVEIKNDSKFVSVYRGFLDLKSQWEENCTDLQEFWLSYIDMVDILLNTLYAVRSGDWYFLLKLH